MAIYNKPNISSNIYNDTNYISPDEEMNDNNNNNNKNLDY